MRGTRTFRRALVALATAALVLTLPRFPVALGAGIPTVSAPATVTADRNSQVAITGIGVTANGATTAQVSLSVGNGTLTLASTTGLTFASGDGTSDATVTFTGSIANVNTAVATVTYTPSANYIGADTLDAQVTEGGSLYFAGTGHFYEFVSASGAAWNTARDAAAARTLYGMTGYLVTVTSAGENAFVQSKLAGQGWMGATDQAVEKNWRWVTGPEAGTQFWWGTASDCGTGFDPAAGPVGGLYDNWASGEPNNCDEDYAHFLSNGEWNDYPLSMGGLIAGYVVEYGGMPGDTPTVSTDSTAITVQAAAPGAPTAVSATRGNESAQVSWTAPADGGSAITGYTVTAGPGGATATVAGGVTTANVTGLTNGVAYTFTVRATNAVGTGPASSASAPVTPAKVPDAPTPVTATRGDGQATVSWSAAAGNGSAVSGYTVTVSPGGATVSVGGGVLSTTITGLTNGVTYTFTVKATNAAGTGPGSAPSSVTPATVPGAPSDVRAASGYRRATVSWSAPDANGSPITRYVVTASPGGATATVAAPATSADVTGLRSGVTYTFRVAAYNDVGSGAPSGTAAATPSSPPNPVVLVPGNGRTLDGQDPVDVQKPEGSNAPVVALARRAGSGTWGVTADGRLLVAGGAPELGDASRLPLRREITAMAGMPDGGGYYFLGKDGGVFAFGNAPFLGSVADVPLVADAVAIAPTCTGRGYYIVAADGGVFTFGDAVYHGSMTGVPLNAAIVSIVPRCTNGGYWITGRDGGVFAFGDAGFFGSLGDAPPVDEIAGMNATDDELGYWLIRTNADVVPFGSAR